jgi:hypothetical protein
MRGEVKIQVTRKRDKCHSPPFAFDRKAKALLTAIDGCKRLYFEVKIYHKMRFLGSG